MIVERCDFGRGDSIDGYIVDKLLGEGTFGKVFKVSKAGQVYALKLLKLWELDPELRQNYSARFEMEYQTGRIDSPYLVHSCGHGFVKGNPYIVMEFCSGGDLTGLNRNADWVKIARHVLLGLKALHQHGKVHRDLKPENVLLKQDGTAVLTDFGISGDRNKRLTERNFLGVPMGQFGTWAYMPPEQVNPKRGDATVLPTTDIFSFGVMMYQLLTGKFPFGELRTEGDLALYIKNGSEGNWNRSLLTLSAQGTTFMPIIEGCLRPDFRKRLQSADDVLCLLPSTGSEKVDLGNEYAEPKGPIAGYRLRVMQGEEYGKVYDLNAMRCSKITMGRADVSVQNVITIREEQSKYVSRRHCTLEYMPQYKMWVIHDGQYNAATNGWKHSLNGTYVNSSEVGDAGFYLRAGDIVSIGDVKLRMEAYSSDSVCNSQRIDDVLKSVNAHSQFAPHVGTPSVRLATTGNVTLDVLSPFVYYIQTSKIELSYGGKTYAVNDGYSGTGFLLSDGRFVTARHVVQPWMFHSADSDDERLLILNKLSSAGAVIKHFFNAYSPTGDKMSFISTNARIDSSSDKWSWLGGESYLLGDLSKDWASFQTNKVGRLVADGSLSNDLPMQADLKILGYPLGLGAHLRDNDISPLYSEAKVARRGLYEGRIVITAISYEHGNSGGPVFATLKNGDLRVVGIVSASIGGSTGYIVPISAIR